MNEEELDKFEDIFKGYINILKKYAKKLKRTEVFGLIISTAYTPDCGYETAIIDKNNIYVVERYKTKDECLIGHEKWCKSAKTLTKITELGWLNFTDPEEVILERNFDVDFLKKHKVYHNG
jgi:hypothetical protein